MSSEQAATVRRLRLFVIILCVSNLLLGGAGYYFLRKIDASYSELLGQSVPTLNNLVRLTREVAAAQRASLRLQRAATEAQATTALESIRQALVRCRVAEAAVLDPDRDGRPWIQQELLTKAAAAGNRYRAEVTAFMETARNADPGALMAFNDTRLRPAYDTYLDALDGIATALQRQSERLSAEYSAGATRVGALILGFGGWPLLLALLVLSVVSIVLLVMVLLTRRLAATDEP